MVMGTGDGAARSPERYWDGETTMANSSNRDAIQVFQAGPDDVGRLAPLFDAYRQFYQQPADLPGAGRFLEERLKQNESIILAAEVTDGMMASTSIVGFTQLYPSFSSVSMRPLYILNDLYVVPGSRKLGAGRALLERARAFAASAGASAMVLQTALTNFPAQKLYESLGWRRDTVFCTYELDLPDHSSLP
jgi:ribosomal protein S18 acetylase RimI-like enzyme